MSFKSRTLFLVSAFICAGAQFWPASAKALTWLPWQKLHPLQFTVGRIEIEIKKAEYATLDVNEQLKVLKKKAIKVVRAPNGEYYVIDGHHTAIAFAELNVRKLPVEVVKDFTEDVTIIAMSDMGAKMQKFWELMKTPDSAGKIRVNLSQLGEMKSHEELEDSISKLVDDPYRSLAWLLRKLDVFDNLDMDFQEFKWADYLRQHFGARDMSTLDKLMALIPEVMSFISSTQPEQLPGFRHKFKKMTADDCIKAMRDKFPDSF